MRVVCRILLFTPKKIVGMLTKQNIFYFDDHIKALVISIAETYAYLGIQIRSIDNYIKAIMKTIDTKL